MKKLLAILALLMVVSMVLVACQDPTGTPDDTTEEVTTQDPGTTTDTETETEKPADPVTVHISKDELRYMIGEEQVGAGFPAGQFTSWTDMIATVEDYKVEYIVSWGWASFYGEAVGQFGYQIDDNAPVYDDAFAWETEQPVLDAAGGKPASRYKIYIPVRDLQGEHTIKVLVKDAVGTEEVMYEFTMNKAVDPDAPVAFIPAADMASSIPGSPDIESAAMSADGTYITINTANTNGDPYHDPFYQLPMLNGKGTVASVVAIKYRTSVAGARSEVFVGSGQGPTGGADNYAFDVETDGKWHLMVIDLANTPAVVDGVINYLRWDPYVGSAETASIDMGYIALFNSAEAAQAYDAKFADVYVDLYEVDMNTEANAAIYDGDGFPEAGLPDATFCKLGYNNVVALGAMDLSQFVAVRITYSCDGSDLTAGRFENSSSLAIGLKSQGTSYGQETTDNFDGNLACTDMEFSNGSWTAIRTAVVDLSEVFYNGDVWVAIHNPEGTEVLIHSVTFVYGEKEKPIEVIYYDGTNGSTIVPVEGVKYFVRGQGGMILSIQGAYNFVVTADNLMGSSVVLQPDRFGNIEVEVPEDWFTFELTIDNVCGEPAEFNMTITEPATVVESLIVGENVVNATVTTSGWNDVSLYYFTAPVAGTYYFTLSNDYASGSLYYAEAPIYGMVEQFPLVLDLEAGQTIELGVSADVIMGDLIGATEDIVYGLGLIISDTAPATDEEVVVEDIVLSVDTLGLASQSYAAGTATLGGVDFEYIQMGNYGDGLQMRDKNGNTSSIWNTSAFAAGIAKIELVYSDSKDVTYSNADAVIFTFGNEAQGATYTTKLSTTAGEKTYTITPDADTYTFFKLEHDLGYTMYWKSITIVFADGTTVSA